MCIFIFNDVKLNTAMFMMYFLFVCFLTMKADDYGAQPTVYLSTNKGKHLLLCMPMQTSLGVKLASE